MSVPQFAVLNTTCGTDEPIPFDERADAASLVA